MFTGIIEEVGTLRSATPRGSGRELTISARRALHDVAVGDSIAVNGVCLTVTSFTTDAFMVDAVEETMRKTALGQYKAGAQLNLERALRAGGKLGGHYVQGHVDTTSTCTGIEKRSDSWMLAFMLPSNFQGNVIPVGSIAIDGVSLTVAWKGSEAFGVSIIPHTFENTILATYRVGSLVNLEFDVIGKYVQSFIEAARTPSSLDAGRLRELGY
jgi:riboflavin synthase